MPYHVSKENGGFKVRKDKDGKAMSKKPMTKKKAEAQKKAIEISEANMKKLKEHAKMHKGGMQSKHMKNMKKFMKEGDSFSKAHKKAMEMDKKK